MEIDQVCPKCRTTKYRNPNMKLMVNVCGHNLCESCVELLFAKGSGACPECNIPLRRVNFRIQLFEDASIDKEVDIRRRILRDFNKKEEDFGCLRDYNDYLEMVEDLIFNLTNNIDILETNKKIAQYKEVNKDQITKYRHKQSKDELELEDIMLHEARIEEERRKEIENEFRTEQIMKVKNKEKLIDDLMFSEGDANAIVADHAKSVSVAAPAANRAPKFSQDTTNASIVSGPTPIEQGKPFVYEALDIDFGGPDPPVAAEVVERDYCAHVRAASGPEVAGGYLEGIACLRALQDAMGGLFFSPVGEEA